MTEDRCHHEMLILNGQHTCAWCKGVDTDDGVPVDEIPYG